MLVANVVYILVLLEKYIISMVFNNNWLKKWFIRVLLFITFFFCFNVCYHIINEFILFVTSI